MKLLALTPTYYAPQLTALEFSGLSGIRIGFINRAVV